SVGSDRRASCIAGFGRHLSSSDLSTGSYPIAALISEGKKTVLPKFLLTRDILSARSIFSSMVLSVRSVQSTHHSGFTFRMPHSSRRLTILRMFGTTVFFRRKLHVWFH